MSYQDKYKEREIVSPGRRQPIHAEICMLSLQLEPIICHINTAPELPLREKYGNRRWGVIS